MSTWKRTARMSSITPVCWALRASCQSARIRSIVPGARGTGSRARTRARPPSNGKPRRIGATMADEMERSQQLAAKPLTVSRSRAIMTFTVCFAAGYLLAGSWAETCGGLTEQASAAEPDEIGSAEEHHTPSQPVSTDTICNALAVAAAQNDLP